MTKEYEVGDYLFLISNNQFFKIDRLNIDERMFTYQYKDEYGNINYSFWIEFDDPALNLLYKQNNLLHVKTEQERLAIQLKYSSTI